MKFTEVKTLEHLLKEYATPVGQQKIGANAKQTKTDSTTSTTDAMPDLPDTNTTPNTQIAKNIKKDQFVSTDNAQTTKKVISPVGDGNLPDAMVVQGDDGEYEVIDQTQKVDVVDVEEGKLGNLAKRNNKKLSKSNSIKKRIKQLSRRGLKEADSKLFEINFSTKEVVAEALDLPIKCGFEAETDWTDYSGGGGGQDVDDMDWGEVQDNYYVSSSTDDDIRDEFVQWVEDNKLQDYLDTAIDEWILEVKEDEDWINDFIDSSTGPSSEAIERYKAEFEDTDPTEYENRAEDGWTYMNWAREYVEEEYDEVYHEFLAKEAEQDDDVRSGALEEAINDHSYGDMIYDVYGSMSEFCYNYGIETDSGSGGLEDVASELRDWTMKNSFSDDDHIETGDYGSTHTSGWAVESDSSIDADGCGAEIISPVYQTPRQMLEEMKSQFEWFQERGDVVTNYTTGLHVTMSWNGEAGGYQGSNSTEPNKLKMAALLGDEYLMDTFGRKNNSYTKAQSVNVKKAASNMANGDEKSFAEIEELLGKGVSGDKFSSINFKSEKDRDSGNNLIEFRIGGGEDYHQDMAKVVKAVIRYATIMKAGYDEKAYKDDYAKATMRIVANAGKISSADEKRAQEQFDLEGLQSPLVDFYKSAISKDNYFDGVGDIVNAVKRMSQSELLDGSLASKKKEWVKQWKEFTKATGHKWSDNVSKLGRAGSKEIASEYDDIKKILGEAGEERPSVQGYTQPPFTPPTERQVAKLKKSATEYYIMAMGRLAIDVADGKHRTPVNAKAIGILRNSLKHFDMDETQLSTLLVGAVGKFNIPTQNDRDSQRFKVLKKGVDTLFKKDLLQTPDFLRAPETDRAVTGLWNAINYKDITKDELTQIGKAVIDVMYSASEADTQQNGKIAWQTAVDKREYNDFYSTLTRGSYNASQQLLNVGSPYNKDNLKQLLSLVSKYPAYQEPVSPKHNKNIYNDESYIENYLSKYKQQLNQRLQHLGELKDDDYTTYVDSLQEIGKLTIPLAKAMKPMAINPALMQIGEDDSPKFLSFSNYRKDEVESLVGVLNGEETDPFAQNVISRIQETLGGGIRTALSEYYAYKQGNPGYYKDADIKKLIKERFGAIKNWMDGIDKIAQKIGFDSQAGEIADKRVIDKRADSFDKDRRLKSQIVLNMPSHSFVYVRQPFMATVSKNDVDGGDQTGGDLQGWLLSHKDEFTTKLNSGSNIFVIPAAHWSQVREAVDIVQMLNSLKGYPLGAASEWRRKPAQDVIRKFKQTYGIFFQELEDREKYTHVGSDEQQAFKSAGVEISHDGDSREPNVKPLVPTEDTANQKSGEPFDRSSATMWSLNADDQLEQEMKRFNAFDWTGWEPKHIKWIKDRTEKTESFNGAYAEFNEKFGGQIAMKSTSEAIFIAAGLSLSQRRESTSSIMDLANWDDLAKHFRLGGQGKELLKKYANHYGNIAQDDPDANVYTSNISGGRFVNAVMYAMKQINSRYSQSDGEYTPNNNDSDSKDTDYHYTKDDTLYDKIRNKYPYFNQMMQNGIGNYTPNTNEIVDFLNNRTAHTDLYKTQVLKWHLANRGDVKSLEYVRRLDLNTTESSISKFDKLNLQEQLDLLEKIDGKKIQKVAKGFEHPNKSGKPVKVEEVKVQEDGVPDNTTVRLIKKLLGHEMPAWDLKKQMDAYFIMPDPKMITAFRSRMANGGKDSDLRPIFKSFLDNQLDPAIKKQLQLKEGVDDVIDRIQNLPAEDEKTDKVISYIEQLLDDMGVGGRLASLTAKLDQIDDDEVKKANVKIAKIIASIDMTPLERAQLFASWKEDKLVDTEKLLSGGSYGFEDIFKGYGFEQYMTEFIDDLADVDAYGIGAGEFLLAVLSKKIRGIGASGGAGDLLIDGRSVELKTKTKRNARFYDEHVKPDQTWATKVEEFKKNFADIEEVAEIPTTGMNQTMLSQMLKNTKLLQNPVRMKQVLVSIKGIFMATMTNLSNAQYNELIKSLTLGDAVAFRQKYGEYNILNYLNIKRAMGELEGIAFMDKTKKTVAYVKGLEDIQQNFTLEVGTLYPISAVVRYPFPQIGLKQK